MLKKYFIFTSIFIISLSFSLVSCSDGDRSPFYQNCLRRCLDANCTVLDGEYKTPELADNQNFWDWLLLWNCKDECQYDCMWLTVEAFKRNMKKVPQFHGKWPFKKILGMQEPASVFASLLNLFFHVFMYRNLYDEFPFDDSLIAAFWHCFSWVSMTGWVWSAIFHARDTPFTEFMDYACAFSIVMSILMAFIFRFTYQTTSAVGMIAMVLVMFYYVEHVMYLHGGNINYDYNMMANVIVGMVGMVLWLLWACYQYRKGRQHVHHLITFIGLTVMGLVLELVEFTPAYGLDAHALWHLHTSYLPMPFYRFVIEDLQYLETTYDDYKKPKDDCKIP